MDLTELIQAARTTTNERGEPVVEIPLDVWQAVVGDDEQKRSGLSQAEQIKALLRQWENEPDDQSEEWWEEFEKFLRKNRLHFPERDLGFGDE